MTKLIAVVRRSSFSRVSAALGAGVQGGVTDSTGSQGSSVDRAAGTASAAGPCLTAGQSHSEAAAVTVVVTVASDAAPGIGKPGSTGVQTSNGSIVMVNSRVPGVVSGDGSGNSNSQPAVTAVNNGPVNNLVVVSTAPSTIIRTSTSTQNAVTVISSQPGANTMPTVTLVRPLMQTTTNTSQSASNLVTVSTSPAVSVASTAGASGHVLSSSKSIMQTAQVAATGAAVTLRSPTVLQNLRTSVPSTATAPCPGGIRPIAPQVLAPRLAQPQQSTPNIQNIQLPPGNMPCWKLSFYIEYTELIVC